jgi:hypothetical protein
MGAAAAWAADTTPVQTNQDATIRELQAKVAALEAKQSVNGQEMNATIDSVLRDAEQRSKLLATSGEMSAGYEDGFYIRAGDAFVLKPGVFFQFRNVLNFREDTSGAKADEFDNGFEVRRMRLKLNGTAFSKDLEYSFVWDANREGGGTSLLDAWVKYMFNDTWGIRGGQFKDPLTHEKLVSSEKQIAVDRTLADNLLGGSLYDRVQGVTAIYGGHKESNPLSAEFGITDGGPASMNTNFTKHGFDFGIVGRVEYKLMGDWSAYGDFTAKDNKSDLLVVGGALDWSQAGNGNLLSMTVDAQWENRAGLGVYGAILIQNIDDNLTGASSDTTNWGFVLQGNYVLNPAWEVFGRLDMVLFDDDVAFAGGNTEDTFYELTAGVNYYLGANGSWKHRAKFTVDLGFLPNGAPSNQNGIGVLDANDGGTEIVLRSQFQLVL